MYRERHSTETFSISAMESLLTELSAQEEIRLHCTKSRFQHQRRTKANAKSKPSKGKQCAVCKSVGRPHTGHDVGDCWFLSKFEKMEIAKDLQVTVEPTEEDSDEPFASTVQKLNMDPHERSNSSKSLSSVVQKVEYDASPFFFAFYKHHRCHVVIDTGATSSVVSQSFANHSGVAVKSTLHSVRSADKSSLPILGKVHFTLNFGNLNLPITALVIEKLDCDILAGIPFCKTNDIHIHLKAETFLMVSKIHLAMQTSAE